MINTNVLWNIPKGDSVGPTLLDTFPSMIRISIRTSATNYLNRNLNFHGQTAGDE